MPAPCAWAALAAGLPFIHPSVPPFHRMFITVAFLRKMALRSLAVLAAAGAFTGCVATNLEGLAPQPSSGGSKALRGREIYLDDCTRCHKAEPVTDYTRAQWQKIMPEMIEETKLGPADADAVTAYVMAVSGK